MNYWYMQQLERIPRELYWVFFFKKPIPKDYTLYDSICITFLKRQNYRNAEQISGCQGLRIEGGEKGMGAGVVMELFFISIVVVDTQTYTCE